LKDRAISAIAVVGNEFLPVGPMMIQPVYPDKNAFIKEN
jgi:hypothetical protein